MREAPERRKAVRPASGVEDAPDELPPLIKAYVASVRSAYVMARVMWYSVRSGGSGGQDYQPPRSYDGSPAVRTEEGVILQAARPPVWLRLARYLASRRIDPNAYIQAQFSRERWFQRPPEPSHLMTADAVQFWERDHVRRSDAVRAALDSESRLAQQRITVLQRFARLDMTAATITALADNALSLSPLFRYCLAVSLPTPRVLQVAEEYRVQACLQFCADEPHYLTYWRAFLPEGFAEEAKSVYASEYQTLLTEDDT